MAKYTVEGRNLVSQKEILSQDEIRCHSKKYRNQFCRIGKHFFSKNELPAIGWNVLSQEEIYCHRKKLTVTGRNLSSQEEIYSYRKKFTVTRKNWPSKEEMYCHRNNSSCHWKYFPFTGSNLMSQEIFWIIGSYFLWQEEISCHRKNFTEQEGFLLV